MRGLIYKDVQLFFRSIDKKLILIAVVAIALLLAKAGVYGGLMGSIMLAMTVSMQNIMTFATDEKADWKKYQKALPISNISVIVSKYLSVLVTLTVSVIGSVVFSLASLRDSWNIRHHIIGTISIERHCCSSNLDRNLFAAYFLVRFPFCTNNGVNCCNPDLFI